MSSEGASVSSLVVRPARLTDLDDLLSLAQRLQSGVTTLPANASSLEERIELSRESFARRVGQPGSEHYLFVLEDTASGRAIGTAALIARVGGFDPYYTYELRRERVSYRPLGIDKEMAVLHLKREHKGPSELASLALDPAARGAGAGRLLSLSRLIFVAVHRARFESRLVAELRGYQDAAGVSPFWESVGRHFFERSFAEADFLSGLGDKDFIEELMPRYPIYVALLPAEVRDAIGRVHPNTEPARRMLEEEGMRPLAEVDIFDAGPLVGAEVEELRTVGARREVTVTGLDDDEPRGPAQLLANGRIDFRACMGGVRLAGAAASIGRRAARLLEVEPGDIVHVAPARSGEAG